MHPKKLTVLFLIVLGCSLSAFLHEPPQKVVTAKEANHYMWDQLHRGNYDSIPQILDKLKTAWRSSPDDPILTTHLGFIYLWKFCERGRAEPDSTIFQNVFISNYFFKRSIELNPRDARLYSLQAATEMCEGAIREDLPHILKGYANGLEAVRKWPQFNRFALAAIEGLLDKNSRMYREGLRYQWVTMDECSCKDLSRKDVLRHPEKVIAELITELQQSTDKEIKRACWNSWIAPHNFEGYLMNFGDMLVKAGKKKEAKRIYSAIKLAPSYHDWVYRNVLEDRIRNIDENEKKFNRKLTLLIPKGETQIFINSTVSCVACHQMSPGEFERYGYQEPGAEYYTTDHRSQPAPCNN